MHEAGGAAATLLERYGASTAELNAVPQCTDHEIAKRVRNLAGLNPPGGAGADDIIYPNVNGPSPFGHPLCPNTFRNGVFLGNETPATGY